MRKFWQKQQMVAVEGDLSDFAVENAPTKPTKKQPAWYDSVKSNKKHLQTECLAIVSEIF